MAYPYDDLPEPAWDDPFAAPPVDPMAVQQQQAAMQAEAPGLVGAGQPPIPPGPEADQDMVGMDMLPPEPDAYDDSYMDASGVQQNTGTPTATPLPVFDDSEGFGMPQSDVGVAEPGLQPPPGDPDFIPGPDDVQPPQDTRTADEQSYDRALGIDDEQELASEQGDLQAQQAEQMAKRRVLNEQERMRATAEAKVRSDQHRADLDAKWNQVYHENVDPEHWFNSQNSVGKVGIALGSLFGPLAGVLNGSGRDDFGDWVQGNIKTDLDAQKANLDNHRTLLGQLTQIYGDRDAADMAYVGLRYQQTADSIDAYGAQFNSRSIRIETKKQAAQYRQKALSARSAAAAAAEKARLDAEDRELANAKTIAETNKLNAEAGAKARAGIKAPKASPYTPVDANGDGVIDNADLDDKQAALVLRGPNGQPVRDPETGRYILANSPADATTYRKATAAYQDARAQISEYDRLLKSYGREPSLFGVKSEGRQKMEAQYGRVKRSIVVLDDLGALTGSDYSSLGQSVPPPPGLTTLQVNQQWSKPLLSQLDGKIDADIGQLGYSGSYAKDAQNLVSHKSGDISGKPPGERDAEANEAARGQAGLEPTGTDSEPLYVQIGGATHELTNDDRTRKMLSSGKAKLSTPKQIQQYQVLNFASGEEPAEPVAETPAKKPAKKSKADAAADEEKKRKRAAMTHEAAD